MLYADAIISPGVCGFIWATTTSRVIMAAGETGTTPAVTAEVNDNGTPWVALLVTFVVGAIFFLPFPSWQKMVSYASAATVLSYGLGPIVLLKMRRDLPQSPHRSFRLLLPYVMAPIAFIASNFVIFWAGFGTVDFMFILLLALVVLLTLYHYAFRRSDPKGMQWDHIWWLAPYFGGMWLMSLIGPSKMGGEGWLPVYWDMALIALYTCSLSGWH